MTTSYSFILAIALLQGCLFSGALTLPASDSIYFDIWLASFDPNNEVVVLNSELCTGATDGFYPFPGQECTNDYYACVNGIQYNKTCPNSFVYDPSVGNCLDPNSAPCKVTTTTTSTTTTTVTTTTTLGPLECGSDGFYPLGTCSPNYYVCVGGLFYPQLCPGNGLFDATVGVCVGPESMPACTPTTTSGPFVCPSDGHFEMSTCSSTYYICIDGIPYEEQCPIGIYDPVFQMCVPINSASPQCKPTTVPPPTTTTPTPTMEPFICPTSEGFFPVPGKCTADYFTCVASSPYIETCPAGIFDPVLFTCIKPENASPPCTVSTVPTSTTTTSPTTTTTPGPFVCPGSGQYPYPGSCTLYYVCGGGSYFVASCPIGQIFNPSTHFCELPSGNVPGCGVYSYVAFYQDFRHVGERGVIF